MTGDSVTILTHENALATKRFWLSKGNKAVEGYGNGKWFSAEEVPVNGIHELAELLTILATEPHKFVIRGQAIPGHDLTRVRRAKNKSVDGPPCFREVPHRWVMIDADKALPLDQCEDIDLRLPGHAEVGIKRLLNVLPECLRGVTCFWQLSSQAGFKPGVRAHLWFWLDRPIGQTELDRWSSDVNDGKEILDPSVFRTVQPNYTANPVFDIGLVDELPVRCGVIRGSRDSVSLPRATGGDQAWRKWLEELKSPLVEKIHDYIRNAACSYFFTKGPDVDSAPLLAAMRIARDEAEENQQRQGDYPDSKLLAEIESGRAYAKARAAAGENLLRAQNGIPLATVGNAMAILTSDDAWRGVLGYNERTLDVVFLKEPPFEAGQSGQRGSLPRKLTDKDQQRLAAWFERNHQMPIRSHIAWDAAIAVAEENSFEPVREWLEGLAWDAVPRLDSWLVDLANVLDGPYARRVGPLWMISAAARVYDPGCKVDTMLILEGPQGYRKSSLLEALAMRPEWFTDQLPRDLEKEAKQQIHGPLILEIAELHAFSRKEASAINQFLTVKRDRFRAPYGRAPADHARRGIFAGSTNKEYYLQDETGGRRFWPVKVLSPISMPKVMAVREQLWAEAVARYKAGEAWHVESEDPLFQKEQDERFDSDEWEEAIQEAIIKGSQSLVYNASTDKILPGAQRLKIPQLLEHVFNKPIGQHNKSEQLRVAKILTRMKWHKIRSGDNGELRFWVPK